MPRRQYMLSTAGVVEARRNQHETADCQLAAKSNLQIMSVFQNYRDVAKCHQRRFCGSRIKTVTLYLFIHKAYLIIFTLWGKVTLHSVEARTIVPYSMKALETYTIYYRSLSTHPLLYRNRYSRTTDALSHANKARNRGSVECRPEDLTRP